MIRKLASLLLAIAMMGSLLVSNALAQEEKVLNILTWELYIDQDTVLTPFTEETGIRVNYTNFSLNEEMIAKLEANGGGEYDIVLASDYALDILRKEGLLASWTSPRSPITPTSTRPSRASTLTRTTNIPSPTLRARR